MEIEDIFCCFTPFLMMLLRDIVQRTLSTKNYVLECDVWQKRMSKESLPVPSRSGCGRVVLWPFIGWLLTSTQENVTQDENVACSASPLQQSTIVQFTVYSQKKKITHIRFVQSSCWFSHFFFRESGPSGEDFNLSLYTSINSHGVYVRPVM